MGAHRCFACHEKNPMRIVKREGDDWTFEFVERFVGPRGRAHGGTAIGALTCPALQMAEADGTKHPVALSVSGRLNFPLPLNSPIQVNARSEGGQYHFELYDGEMVFLYGKVQVLDKEVEPGGILQKPPAGWVDDLKALSQMADAKLSGPTLLKQYMKCLEEAGKPWDPPPICFGCSESETGLKLRTRIPQNGHLWTLWDVDSDLTDDGNRLAATIVTAALDCPTLWVVYAQDMDQCLELSLQNKIWITGSYRVHFIRVPPIQIGGGYRVAARYLRRDGLKSFSMSALLDQKGTVYALGEAVAIQIDLPEGYTP